jgi:hypothetical protein
MKHQIRLYLFVLIISILQKLLPKEDKKIWKWLDEMPFEK